MEHAPDCLTWATAIFRSASPSRPDDLGILVVTGLFDPHAWVEQNGSIRLTPDAEAQRAIRDRLESWKEIAAYLRLDVADAAAQGLHITAFE